MGRLFEEKKKKPVPGPQKEGLGKYSGGGGQEGPASWGGGGKGWVLFAQREKGEVYVQTDLVKKRGGEKPSWGEDTNKRKRGDSISPSFQRKEKSPSLHKLKPTRQAPHRTEKNKGGEKRKRSINP